MTNRRNGLKPKKAEAATQYENAPKTGFPVWAYSLLLVLATVFWGGNFVIAKMPVGTIGSSWVVGIRFLLGGIIMGIALFPRMQKHMGKKLLFAGCAIGVFSFLGYWSQFFGLEGTTPAKNAFLSTCYCVVVPFLWWLVARRKPTGRNLIAAAVCVVGLGLVTLQNDFSISWGDGVSMLSAVLYGGEIVAIGYFLKDNDPLCIGVIQMIVSGILGCALGLVTLGPPDISTLADPSMIASLAYITLLGSCFGVTAQNLAQQHISPSQAGMLCALESIFGTIFSTIFWGEALTPQIIFGFVLIFVAVVLSQLEPNDG